MPPVTARRLMRSRWSCRRDAPGRAGREYGRSLAGRGLRDVADSLERLGHAGAGRVGRARGYRSSSERRSPAHHSQSGASAPPNAPRERESQLSELPLTIDSGASCGSSTWARIRAYLLGGLLVLAPRRSASGCCGARSCGSTARSASALLVVEYHQIRARPHRHAHPAPGLGMDGEPLRRVHPGSRLGSRAGAPAALPRD